MSVLCLADLLVTLAGSVLCCGGGAFEGVQVFATEGAGWQTLCAHSMGRGARHVCLALAMLMWARALSLQGVKQGGTLDKHNSRPRIQVSKLNVRVICSNSASLFDLKQTPTVSDPKWILNSLRETAWILIVLSSLE